MAAHSSILPWRIPCMEEPGLQSMGSQRVGHNRATLLSDSKLEFTLPNKKRNKKHPTSQQSTLNIHWKDWCWSWSSPTSATWCEEPTHWKRPWCWGRLTTEGEGGDRGWDGWMASLTQWTWVWANSRRCWRTKEPWHAAVRGVANSPTWLSDWTQQGASCLAITITFYVPVGRCLPIWILKHYNNYWARLTLSV